MYLTPEQHAQLKVGDAIIVSRHLQPDELRKIDHITPTGRIKVGGVTYNQHGWRMGGDGWNRSYLVPATPERILAIRLKQSRLMLKHADWDKLPADLIYKMAAMLPAQ